MKSRFGIRRIAAMLLGGALFVLVARAPAFAPLRARIAAGLTPVIIVLDRATDRLARWFDRGAGKRLGDLEHERVELLAEISRREELVRENETLREALSLRASGEAGVLPATVIGFIREGRDEYLVLDRGTADGIGVGDLVISKERALGGAVAEVSAHAAKALLSSSGAHDIEVLFAGKNIAAIARGNNNREFAIDLVPQDAAIQAGDLIVASPRATGGRRSLLLAEVREVRPAEHEVFKTVRATHLFDPTENDVLVLLAPE
ncbi:MAG: hypothetical protein A3A44_03740 [Candidatus Sungbacteria bacterium RIFCSPLOWO2_01_FULL_60_25]|uniref:Cell shape-determining protein MreC n=1 Tax=Candidatus Sungbacteria bacterium RIFCSPLOWO2_01_FULL_60_25 TaxID=1802281 RepID=A0A1G2LE79_9BACT|nr:MAG: hypothetical protein A3A44_03740 [Candidatus Sungbacteria bacterium RIFCSPLOWO2_01_FULL_60_25]